MPETTTTTTPEASDPTEIDEGMPTFGGTPYGIGVPGAEDLQGLILRAAGIEKAFDALVVQHVEHMSKKREQLDQEARNATHGVDAPAATKALVAKVAEQKAEKQYGEFVRGVRAITQEPRDEMLRQLDALNRRAQMVTKLFPTPIQMLAVAGLGSAERSTYHAQVAHAGAAELGTLAHYAIATGNSILASAVMARLDHLPRSMAKPFRAGQLAEAVMGERHRAATTAARTVGATFQRFVNQNRAFERGRSDLVANIRDALTLHELKKA